MNWITPSVADFKANGINEPELDAVMTALRAGVAIDDVIQASINKCADFVASEVTTNGRPRGPEGTIPKEAMMHFYPLVLNDLIGTRLVGPVAAEFLSGPREKAYLQAIAWLGRKAKEAGGIADPEEPAPAALQAPSSQGAIIVTKLATSADLQGTSGLL